MNTGQTKIRGVLKVASDCCRGRLSGCCELHHLRDGCHSCGVICDVILMLVILCTVESNSSNPSDSPTLRRHF